MTQLSIFTRPSAFALMCEELEKEGDPDGLRYYQRECYDAVLASLGISRSALVVMATGLGKTQLFSAVAKHWDGDVLVLAHRDELVDQARKRLEQMTTEYVEVEKAEMVSSVRTRIVVGSVQSFNKKRLDRLGPKRFSLIIVDEAHHAIAPSYKKVFDFFTGAKILGVTATPDRGDEKALGKVFDDVAYVFDIQDGIESGYLVPFGDYKRVVIDDIDLDHIGKTAGDFKVNELDEEMAKNCEAIVRKTIELQPNRTAICFFPGVRSADLAAQRFNAHLPGSAAFVSGNTEEFARRQIMKDFREQRIRYLCNCQVATEGFDAPATAMIVQGRPTLSRALYAQMTGRGTRVLPGVVDVYEGAGLARERREAIAKSKKPNLVVLDFVGNSQKHDLATVTDILGGDYTEAEVKAAKKLQAKGAQPGEALKEARRTLKAAADAVAQAKVTVKATVYDVNPFNVLGLKMAAEERYTSRFGGKPASPKQLAALATYGVPQEELNQLSMKSASKLLSVCIGRSKHGMCDYDALRKLQRFGVTEKNVSKERWRAAAKYLASKGWGNKGTVDPNVLQDIIHHRREAGEEG